MANTANVDPNNETKPPAGAKEGDQYFTVLVGETETPFVLPASIFSAFPGTYLADRTTIDPASFPFADALIIRLPGCPADIFRRVVLPFYDVQKYPFWNVPGFDCEANLPFEIPSDDRIAAILAVLSEGAVRVDAAQTAQPSPPDSTSLPNISTVAEVPSPRDSASISRAATGEGEGGAVEEEAGENDGLVPAQVDWHFAYALQNKMYVPSAGEGHWKGWIPALDRMMGVLQRQIAAHSRLTEWHAKRTAILRDLRAGCAMKLPMYMKEEVSTHFRLDGLKLETNRIAADVWSQQPQFEMPWFAPQACKASDVEFQNREAVQLMRLFEDLGLKDKAYFRRFDMKTDEVHLKSCTYGRNQGDIILKPVKAVFAEQHRTFFPVGDVDELIPLPDDAKAYRPKDLERVPKQIFDINLDFEELFVKSNDGPDPYRYERPTLPLKYLASKHAFDRFVRERQSTLASQGRRFTDLEHELYRDWASLSRSENEAMVTPTPRVSPYRMFMNLELTRIKVGNPGMRHKDAFYQAVDLWKASPLNPANQG
ncbi:hypothetical protein HK405_006200 [Cladochytrium tenue]|nr:hypothetical protein HK405_006200 [Cladochytrium tenue]